MLVRWHQQEFTLAWRELRAQNRKSKPRVPAGQRIYAVGDIHGRADLLEPLFERIDYDVKASSPRDCTEVFLGDYIDRGPHSRQVLDLLIDRRLAHATMFLMGNHELLASQVVRDSTAMTAWKRIGGGATLVSYGVTVPDRADPNAEERAAIAFRQALPESHCHFLESLALTFTAGDFFFAHAGVRPGIRLTKQSQHDLLWIRDDFLLHEEDFGKVIVHGHTPAAQPDIRPNRINIDTGAYATGRLTCLVLEGEQMRFL
jgi:serine/threonine protein phosphatase 1